MKQFQRLPENRIGRDFAVGDIHGCFDTLRAALRTVKFIDGEDRLFSVGDLVDRGPSSHEAVDWLDTPGFYAVRGNHEQLAIDAYHDITGNSNDLHCVNGGLWFYGLSAKGQGDTVARFQELPLAIETVVGGNKVGFVHAEVPGDDWDYFVATLLSPPDTGIEHVERFALWGRDLIRGRSDFSGVANVHSVYVGHTPVKEVSQLHNVHYIDTGACFGKSLTLVELGTGAITTIQYDKDTS